jgi:hypothetical protein
MFLNSGDVFLKINMIDTEIKLSHHKQQIKFLSNKIELLEQQHAHEMKNFLIFVIIFVVGMKMLF